MWHGGGQNPGNYLTAGTREAEGRHGIYLVRCVIKSPGQGVRTPVAPTALMLLLRSCDFLQTVCECSELQVSGLKVRSGGIK